MVNGEHVAALPTRVLVILEDKRAEYELADEAAELDFIQGKFVTKYQKLEDGTKIPIEYTGLQKGDTVLMTLGGSGDPLAYAISRKGEDVGYTLYRMPPWALKAIRGDKPSDQKDRDISELEALMKGWTEKSVPFYHCGPADRERIAIAAAYGGFKNTQIARMGHVARMRQAVIGRVFMSPDGLYPEGLMSSLIENLVSAIKKFWPKKSKPVEVYEALVSAEAGDKRDLESSVENSRMWPLFEPIEGVGPSIAGGMIAAVGDIRKFETHPKLWAFCGLHTLKPDGTKFKTGEKPMGGIMARRRSGQLSNWNPKIRQSLYLLGDQFNRRPNSYWGQKLRENKRLYREKYPEPIKNEQGKNRYNDGHIHKMATWKTLRQFTRWLYREWTRLENYQDYQVRQPWEPEPDAKFWEELKRRKAA